MANNEFAQGLIEILLSWMRLIASGVWNFFQADMGDGFLVWFADHWVGIAVLLIAVGVIVDWLIWLIRWRPYWLWLRKRQIIYEDVDKPAAKEKRPARPRPQRHMPQLIIEEIDEEDDDETTESEDDNEEIDYFGENAPDPYLQAHQESKAAEDDFSDWDIENDPYATNRSRHTDYDPAIYARPAMGESSSARPTRKFPVLNEKNN